MKSAENPFKDVPKLARYESSPKKKEIIPEVITEKLD